MKKLLTVLFTILMVFTITACQKTEVVNKEENITNDSEPIFLCDDKYCLVGSYSDSVSQRVYMDVSVNSDETYNIIVHWADSASSEKEWVISNAKYDIEKQIINYEGEYISTVTYDDTGVEVSRETTATNNLGYFAVKDKILS